MTDSPAPAPTPDRSTMTTSTGFAPTSTRRRRVRPVNTLFGLFFLAVSGIWAARGQDVLDGDEIGRAVAVGLIALGALGLVATLVVSRRGRAPGTEPDGTAVEDYEAEDIASERRA